MPETISVASDGIKAEIAMLGAELVGLADGSGRDYLWSGDPQWWSGRAPLLFPMVGRAFGDQIKVEGLHYPLPQHGFARRSRFSAVESTLSRCVLRLNDSEQTRAAYPFAFRLDLAYEVQDATLRVTATVSNPGNVPLPCSFGFHPAFRWPLPGATGTHEVAFEYEETAPIRRLAKGLIEAQTYPNPFVTGKLAPDAALFEHDALVFDQLKSRRATFGPAGGPTITVAFPDMPNFGLWSKPGAPFICLEPWQGFASPADFDGEFAERPGVVCIAPGGERAFGMAISIAALA